MVFFLYSCNLCVALCVLLSFRRRFIYQKNCLASLSCLNCRSSLLLFWLFFGHIRYLCANVIQWIGISMAIMGFIVQILELIGQRQINNNIFLFDNPHWSFDHSEILGISSKRQFIWLFVSHYECVKVRINSNFFSYYYLFVSFILKFVLISVIFKMFPCNWMSCCAEFCAVREINHNFFIVLYFFSPGRVEIRWSTSKPISKLTMEKILDGIKSGIIWTDNVGLDANALIPVSIWERFNWIKLCLHLNFNLKHSIDRFDVCK